MQIPFVVVAGVGREWTRSMRGALFFASIIFIVNFLSLHFYGYYSSVAYIVERSVTMTVRFLVLVETFSIFFLTTSPDLLGLALEQSGFPYDICFAFTTAVRFVPVLAEEAQTIVDAQKARGLELEGGNFVKRIKNYIPILVPLLVNSIRRSLELAETMESRAWGASRKRTNIYALKIGMKDVALTLFSIMLLTVSLYTHFFVEISPISQMFS